MGALRKSAVMAAVVGFSLMPKSASAQCTGEYFVITSSNSSTYGGVGGVPLTTCSYSQYDRYACDGTSGPISQQPAVCCVPTSVPCTFVPPNTCSAGCTCNPSFPLSPMCAGSGPLTPPTSNACAGNPFTTSGGNSHIEEVDVQIPGALGGLTFKRTFSSTVDDWMDNAPFEGTPTPFGASSLNPTALVTTHAPQWTHSALALVVAPPSAAIWSVRDRGGQILNFQSCTSAPCWALPTASNKSIPQRLQRTVTGFVLWQASGEQLVFDAAYFPLSTGTADRYFLSQVLSPAGKPALTLTYQAPASLTCPLGATGTLGVPYLYELSSPEATLRFTYLSRTHPTNGVDECVLKSAVLVNPAGGTSSTVFDYTYSSTAGGLLTQAVIGSPAVRTQTYDYSSGNFSRAKAGTTVTTHVVTAGKVSSDIWIGGNFGSVSWGYGSCAAGSDCCGALPIEASVADSAARKGDGSGPPPAFPPST